MDRKHKVGTIIIQPHCILDSFTQVQFFLNHHQSIHSIAKCYKTCTPTVIPKTNTNNIKLFGKSIHCAKIILNISCLTCSQFS